MLERNPPKIMHTGVKYTEIVFWELNMIYDQLIFHTWQTWRKSVIKHKKKCCIPKYNIFSMVVRKGNPIISKWSCIRFANIIHGIFTGCRIYKHTFYKVLKPNRFSPHIFRCDFHEILRSWFVCLCFLHA